MSSAEFIYQLGYDAGVESRNEEVIRAIFRGEKEFAESLIKVWKLDQISNVSEIKEIDGLIAAILATAGMGDIAKSLVIEKEK